ncbi:hypothetical protein [Dactylosporangium sp. CS-033363]|uniref:hypothetical protein n=1 Tax=Dactylosporangium sp. CS-033363 TaxID=3239935 RepID=UPI003D8CF3BC
MPQAPAVIGDLAASVLGRTATVLAVREPAPGFLELELHSAAPPGGWQPGHEVQFRVTPTQGRRYTVRTVAGERIGLLIATEADGPGTAFMRGLRPGMRTTVLTGRHRPMREPGTRRLYLGDGSALGTIDAIAHPGAVVVVALAESAIAPLASRFHTYHFGAHAWREHLGDGFDGAVLLGHAQTIQVQRRALIEGGILTRRAIAMRPYWADGKTGL